MPARARPTAAPSAPSPKPAADPAPAPAPLPSVAPLAGYRGLKVWQRAMDLAASVYRVTKLTPDEALAEAMWRSASAVPTNIAVGNTLYARTEYVGHLSAAHGEVARLESLVHLADRIGAIPGIDAQALLNGAAEVGRMLRGLARALQPKSLPEAAETAH